MDNEVKIEIVDVCQMNEYGLAEMEPDQIVEVITSSCNSSDGEDSSENPKPRKRAKLDHLSADEKAQHRKMMNRISAQSARDRQKALMGQQEIAIKSLSNQNTILKQQTDALKKENCTLKDTVKDLNNKNDNLSEENDRLTALVKELEEKLAKQNENLVSREKLECKPEIVEESVKDFRDSLEPAVPSTVPLQKGLDLQKALTFLLLVWTLSLLISKRQSSYKLWNSLQKKSSALTPSCWNSIKSLQQKENVKNSWSRQNSVWEYPKIKAPG
jgi:chromosome segregation ATPase